MRAGKVSAGSIASAATTRMGRPRSRARGARGGKRRQAGARRMGAQPLGLGAQAIRLAPMMTPAPAVLAPGKPGAHAADHGPEGDRDEQKRVQGQRDAQVGRRARRVEGKGHRRAVRHREKHDDDRDGKENQRLEELSHVSPAFQSGLSVVWAGIARVQPGAHFLAGLERRNHLFAHGNGFARARVSSGARVAPLDRERSEAAQLHAVAALERVGDRVQDRVDDVFDVALVKVRVLLSDLQNQFGLDHGRAGSRFGLLILGRGLYWSRAGRQRASRPSSLAPSAASEAWRNRSAAPSKPSNVAPAWAAVQRLRPRSSRGRHGRTGRSLATPFSRSSHATASRSLPSASTSFSGSACRPLKMRPVATTPRSASLRLRRSATRRLNHSAVSPTTCCKAARASGLVGWNGLGSALSGADLISSTRTPTVSSSFDTSGYWNSTPIEPTSEVSRATMWSAASAVM